MRDLVIEYVDETSHFNINGRYFGRMILGIFLLELFFMKNQL